MNILSLQTNHPITMGIVQDYLEDHFSTEVSEFLTIAVDSWSVLNSCVMLMSCILCCTRIQEKHKRLAVFSAIFSRLLFLVLKLILGGLTEPSRVVYQLDDVLHVFLHTCSYISARYLIISLKHRTHSTL